MSNALATQPPGLGHHATSAPARIGPNALIQTVAALRERYGDARAEKLLRQMRHAHLIDHLPAEMVDEHEFTALATALVAVVGLHEAKALLARSGQLTAGYLLAHRIPGPFQTLLQWLPDRFALRLLCVAIGKAAWTFVGSGAFRVEYGYAPRLVVDSSIEPIAAVRHFYGGTFRALIHQLIDPQAKVTPVAAPGDQPHRCLYLVEFHTRTQRGH